MGMIGVGQRDSQNSGLFEESKQYADANVRRRRLPLPKLTLLQ